MEQDMTASRNDTPDQTLRIQVSALVDGELDDATIERTIDALLASDDLARFWAHAHRAGDWMRSDEVVGVGDGQALLRRICSELANEPTVLAPPAGRSRRFWVRTGLPGASVAAALLVVAWVATPLGRGNDGGARLAGAQPTVMIVPSTGSSQAGVQQTALKAVDPERLSDYLAAHRDVTPFAYRGSTSVRSTVIAASDAKPGQP